MITYTVEKRLILSFFMVYIFFCIAMDLRLYYRVQNYSIRPTKDEPKYESTVPCDLNPFCAVTVKGLMLDYLNFYVLGPLAAFADRIFLLSKMEWLSPNYISFFHVFIAGLAGKLISNKSLSQRRIGVIVYQVRSWLDDVDGLVARKRKNISGEHSDVGSSGYYVDAICDSLGTVALIIGIYYYLKSNLAARGRGDYYLVEAGWCTDGKVICITEPRRVAATSLANRVADERGCILGTEVGYSIRFDDCTDETTKIKYMTEGILLREMMSDPLLTNYCIIILDEVHERTLLTDIIMGLLKKIIRKRKDLKVIVSSATVDAEELRDYFNISTSKDPKDSTSTILSVEGRLYPVDIFYVKEPVPDYVKAVVDTALKIHSNEEPGDILAFLTGMDEVDRAVSLLKEHAELIKEGKQKLMPLPMYGSLPNNDQLKVFWKAPNNTRKVVIATNIAETSITIPNIVYIIDSGFAKIPWFDVDTHTNSLIVAPVSKASADQRAGRAGRVQSGKAYRLYTESAYDEFIESNPPQMQRSDLAPAILQLKALGIDNVLRFNFPSVPPSKSLVAGLELLYALGAIDKDGSLTKPLGLTMAEMPLEPVFAKCLYAAGEMGCSDEISTILSMFQVQNILIRPSSGQASIRARIAHRKFEVEEGDLITMLNIYTAYEKIKSASWCQKYFLNFKGLKRATEIRSKMRIMMKNLNIPLRSSNGDLQLILRCLTAGLFPNAAFLHYTGVYKTVRGDRDLYIHPNSCLYTVQQPQWVLFCEILQTTKLYMRELTVIKSEWLLELAPHFYERTALNSV